MNYGYKVTTGGRELLAALLATGKELEITRVAVGSGKVTEETNLADMTDLVEYVAEGMIAQRRHVENVLYLTVQYASNHTPGLPAFYLAEFAVWARHPVTGADVLTVYATLGDYIQPVMAYAEDREPDVRQYPLALVLSDEINVTISCPAGLVTYEDLQAAVETACRDMVDSLASGGIKKTIEATVAPDQWQSDPNPVNGYIYFYNLEDPEISEKQIPGVTVAEGSLAAAYECGMCQTATAFNGYVRLKCVEKPTVNIALTCTLSEKGTSGGGGVGDLPVATEETLGAIKASQSVRVDPDGTAHAVAEISPDSFASDAEAQRVINDAFGDPTP